MLTGNSLLDKEEVNPAHFLPVDVRYVICEVAAMPIKLSEERDSSRRRLMGMTPHPTATNNSYYRLARIHKLLVISWIIKQGDT